MSIANLFRFRSTASTGAELPDLFPLGIGSDAFIKTDVETIYSKILTDCIERTQGIPETVETLLWDNCLQNESNRGLITLLSEAMAGKKDLFLVYAKAVGILREATHEEASKIREDYKTKGVSPVGVYVSFKNYRRTDMVKLYSAMEYCVVASLNKSANISKAVQIKMSKMRGDVALTDSAAVVDQAQAIATALSRGKDILLDKDDEVATAQPDVTAVKESIAFLDGKRAFYLGMPLSYINGEQTSGIGSTGEADMRATERGLKSYFVSILRPVIKLLFGAQVTFKSRDFRQIGSALEAVKTFELVGDDLVSLDNKRVIVSALLDIENDLEGQPREEMQSQPSPSGNPEAPAVRTPGDDQVQPE